MIENLFQFKLYPEKLSTPIIYNAIRLSIYLLCFLSDAEFNLGKVVACLCVYSGCVEQLSGELYYAKSRELYINLAHGGAHIAPAAARIQDQKHILAYHSIEVTRR